MKTITEPLSLAIFIAALLLILTVAFWRPIRNACLTLYGKCVYPDFVEVTPYGTIIEGRSAHRLDGQYYDGIVPPDNGPITKSFTTITTEDGQTICPEDIPPVGGTVDVGWETEAEMPISRGLQA